jgi:hypothetical protein
MENLKEKIKVNKLWDEDLKKHDDFKNMNGKDMQELL